jgi:hypothetical protein
MGKVKALYPYCQPQIVNSYCVIFLDLSRLELDTHEGSKNGIIL